MPVAPPSRCSTPTCPHLAVQRGRCEHHYVPWEQPSANTRTLSGGQRARIRREQLAREPNCRSCGAPATQADHIIPISEGGARTSPHNLQSLCEPCHDDKTREEARQRNRARANHTT